MIIWRRKDYSFQGKQSISSVYIGLKYVYIDTFKVHFIIFRFFSFNVTMSFRQSISETKDLLWIQPHLKGNLEELPVSLLIIREKFPTWQR